MRHPEHEWMCFPTKISCNSHRIFTMYSYFQKKKNMWRCSLYSQINNYHFICCTWYKSVKGSQSIPTKFDWPGQWHARGAVCSFAFESKFSVLRQKVIAFFFRTTRIWLSKVMYSWKSPRKRTPYQENAYNTFICLGYLAVTGNCGFCRVR